MTSRVQATRPFHLVFPIADLQHWAARYSYADATAIETIGASAGRRGWYTRDEFLTLMLWKTQRTKSLCPQNTESDVVEATRLALATADERLRIKALLELRGIAFPTASTLLHFALPDSYPILDVRAIWSLGIDQRPRFYSFEFWWDYVQTCRSLAREAGVPLRTLDRALWQYAKEHQPSTVSAAPALRGARGAGVSPGPNKSATMRRLYEQGQTVAVVAKSLGVAYGFAYGVHRRWQVARRTKRG
jgi:hypothetical protein